MNIMAVRAIENEADFTLHVSHAKGVVLVAFWAPWCEPCKMIRSEIKRAAQSFTGRTEVFKVDVDELHSIAEKYEIMAVPTLLFLRMAIRSSALSAMPRRKKSKRCSSPSWQRNRTASFFDSKNS